MSCDMLIISNCDADVNTDDDDDDNDDDAGDGADVVSM